MEVALKRIEIRQTRRGLSDGSTKEKNFKSKTRLKESAQYAYGGAEPYDMPSMQEYETSAQGVSCLRVL